MSQVQAVQPTEAQIGKLCTALGWELLRVGTYGGEIGYLVEDEAGITEPHSAREIVQTARDRGVLRRRKRAPTSANAICEGDLRTRSASQQALRSKSFAEAAHTGKLL